jgi:Uma2 family endonuclease
MWVRERAEGFVMATIAAASDDVFIEPVGQMLTPEEYDALPENPRRELVDGVIHVMVTPRAWHQRVKIALYNALARLQPRDVEVVEELEIRLADRLRRNPDVLVVRASDFDWQMAKVFPRQVVLAVEIVSPGSESDDRILKPRQYAQAGIEHYWRVETEPEIVMHTYRLGDEATYIQTGILKSGDVINAPGLVWAQVPVEDLVARR